MVGNLKNKMKARNEKDWEEEVYRKAHGNGIGWQKMVQRWRDVRSVQGQESVRLLFRLRTGSAGLLEDKKICRMVSGKRCVMCDSGVGEDVDHFLVGCGGFERDRLVLLDDVCRTMGPESNWINFGEWTRRER